MALGLVTQDTAVRSQSSKNACFANLPAILICSENFGLYYILQAVTTSGSLSVYPRFEGF